MIIESIFQGKIPIRRIYLNGHVVWKPPAYLPPYVIYLDNKVFGDRILTKIHLEQGHVDIIEDPITSRFHAGSSIHVEPGNQFVDNIGRMYTQGNPIGADIFLVNLELAEEYSPIVVQNVMNALHIEQIKGEYFEGPELFVNKYGISLDAMIGSLIVDEETCFLKNRVGLSARGAILSHDTLIKVLFDSLVTGVSSAGRIMDHDAAFDFIVDHNATGYRTNGKMTDHNNVVNHIIDHNATGLRVSGEMGDYDQLVILPIDHNTTSLGAKSELADHSNLINLLIDPEITTLAGKAEHGKVSAMLTINVLADRSSESLDSKLLTANREESTIYTTDSHLTNLNIPTIKHDAEFDLKYTADITISSVSSESVSFVKYGEDYVSEIRGSKSDVAGLNLDTTMKAAVNLSATIHAMFWLYPVQTGSDLYIPQVYDNGIITGAVQNGSELIM